MKKIKLNTNFFGKFIALPVALFFVSITVDSCKKDNGSFGAATPTTAVNVTASEKSAKLDAAVEKALKDFVINVSVNVNQPNSSVSSSVTVTGTGTNFVSVTGNSNAFANVMVNVNVFTTPTANVVIWSNSAGSSFTFSSSLSTPSNGGTGFGQITLNGKTFNYNHVLCVKSSLKDTTWSNLFNGHGTDMRGVIAFDGDTTNNDFLFRNMAVFLVDARSANGNYNFVNWNTSFFKSGDAIGKILDFSGATNRSIAGISLATPLFTSAGSISVDSTSFTLSSDAKVTNVYSLTEYPVSGKITCK
jgi:hypothetical protein